ncbi:MAG TPA: hypothetical protein ENK02_14595 [Planctomycetes bacterium]|nr:hypothetical protein [Planctomycetota bacterium]
MKQFLNTLLFLTGFALSPLLAIPMQGVQRGTKPIAVWGYTDQTPVREILHLGVAAYHENGIASVDFYYKGVFLGRSTKEALNPETNTPEYFLTIPIQSLPDGDYPIQALVIPKGQGIRLQDLRILPEIRVRVWNAPPRNTYFVDPTLGNDKNPGTVLKPWRSWKHAELNSKGGDAIILASGVYEPFFDRNQNNRREHKLWLAAQGAKVWANMKRYETLQNYSIFQGIQFFTRTGYAFRAVGTNHVVFRNCSFLVDPKLETGVLIYGMLDSQGKGMTDCEWTDCFFLGARKAFSFTSTRKEPNQIISKHARNIFRNLRIEQVNDGFMIDARDSLWTGITSSKNAKRLTKDHCDFFQFIWGKSQNLIIRDLKLFDSGRKEVGMTFVILTGDGQLSDTAFLNCAVQVEKRNSHIFYFAPNAGIRPDHVCIVNCTLLAKSSASSGVVLLSGSGTNLVLANNLLYNFTAYPVQMVKQTKAFLFDYNGFENTWANTSLWGRPHNRLIRSLMLTNPGAGDFRPLKGSQAINAGAAVFAPPFDLNRKPRKDGFPDLGAGEF